MNMATVTVTMTIAPDDPSLDGHFPGRPIVPAVVLLDLASRALRAQAPHARVRGVAQAKFQSPLLPGETLHIECEFHEGAASAGFRCVSAGRVVADGVLVLDPGSPER